MATGAPKAIVTHAQRVCRLYKNALRTLEMHARDRYVKLNHISENQSETTNQNKYTGIFPNFAILRILSKKTTQKT